MLTFVLFFGPGLVTIGVVAMSAFAFLTVCLILGLPVFASRAFGKRQPWRFVAHRRAPLERYLAAFYRYLSGESQDEQVPAKSLLAQSSLMLLACVGVAMVFGIGYWRSLADEGVPTSASDIAMSLPSSVPYLDSPESTSALTEWARCRYGVQITEKEASVLLGKMALPFEMLPFYPTAKWADFHQSVSLRGPGGSDHFVSLYFNGDGYVLKSGEVPVASLSYLTAGCEQWIQDRT